MARSHDMRDIQPALHFAASGKQNDHVFAQIDPTDTAELEKSYADQRVGIQGYWAMIRAQFHHTFRWLEANDVAGCFRKRDCNLIRKQLLIDNLIITQQVWGLDVYDKHYWALGLCTMCALQAVQGVHHGRQAMWQDLPSYFGLDPWDVLIASKPDNLDTQ